MKRTFILVLTACFILLGVSYIKAEQVENIAASETSATCLCEKGKSGETVWCDKCGAGYVNGEKVKCKGQFKSKACKGNPSACKKVCNVSALDKNAACLCSKGKAGDTVWCHKCSLGYVDGEKIKCPGQFKAKAGDAGKPSCRRDH